MSISLNGYFLSYSNMKSQKYSIANILGFQKKNDEFYTSEETVKKLIQILQLPKNSIIWCPFDTEESQFVKQLSKRWKVVRSHINEGKDFYNYQPKKWDIIISNPPFSKKRILIERCINFKKPFILLYGTTIFSQSMGNTLNLCDFHFIQRNCKFTCQEEGKIKSFQCCWVMNKGNKNIKR